jgi:Cu2+-containing amine oxidase
MTVTDAQNQTLWEMLIIRPSASSGTRASAIEIQNVKYKGLTVMKRGHVPILNVQYVAGQCGPYRDWQYQEGMFQATGTDVAPGIRDCGTTVATTEVDTGTDTGNFRGVAIYREGSEVVLLTEMEAGWYRYIDEWRFDADGTIRPRYGFGAVVNSCTCLTHDHHVYWRLDMDVDGPLNSIHDIGLAARIASRYPTVTTEKKILRTDNPPHYISIRNPATGRSYSMAPGPKDGTADTYGRGDTWFLRYHSGTTNLTNEFDDGHNSTGPSNTEADLDQFVNNETLTNEDSVIWYHATVRHSPTGFNASVMCIPPGAHAPGSPLLSGDNLVGPTLVPQGF